MLSQEEKEKRSTTRNTLRSRRQRLSLAERQQAAVECRHFIAADPVLSNARNIAIYLDSDGEVPTKPIIELAWSLSKNIFLPVIDNEEQMNFVPYFEQDRLTTSRYGIQCPTIERPPVDPAELDAVIAPLVAFDDNGNRLGRGGGHYDRFMARCKLDGASHRKIEPYYAGLAYSFQKTSPLFHAEWDISLDAVITEQSFIKF